MATSLAGEHSALATQSDMVASSVREDVADPFLSVSTSSNHHRYSHFDNQLFALGPATSPEQAKRALEAHLAETERRIQDASKLGTTLVQQRKDLAERLKEVEKQQTEGDITPELRQKLVEIEREYNEVGRESARAFLPKSRVSSSEMGGSPFVGDRSVSPVKFESQATSSPSKFSVPNRKQRNQPSSRVHDIEFATEISTSLLSQVRHLQSLLAEKEAALKSVTLEKSRLEDEAEGFSQRLRELDESENRYKDENWNLETQIHEHLASAKEAADREKKLTQSLNILQLEKSAAQKELDEIKLSHAKLSEDHAAALKHHDVELGSVKRSMTMAENERGALQRKVEDLVGQNQELAKAVADQRGRLDEREQIRGLSIEVEAAPDDVTPEHSPPPSPVKPTPRHSMLESETLKSSLHHAHRMIQNLKGNIHREKTEKLELKRMLQDARDELDTRRSELSSAHGKKSRKVGSKEFKKPLRLGQLGSVRNSRSEMFIEDPNWEEDSGEGSGEGSPTRSAIGATGAGAAASYVTGSTDPFEAANETSDAGFETANEQRGTETEDFQTGVEEMSGSDGLTETEGGAGGTLRRKRPSALSLRKAGNRDSFQSTASNSDEYTYDEVKTPTSTQPQRLRLKVSRGSNRRSRQASEEPTSQSSPASFVNRSNNGTPQAAGQSLFAELGDLGGSDDESVDGTLSRRSTMSRSATPASRPSTARTAMPSFFASPSLPPVPRLPMVDSGMMTEAWEPESRTSETAVPLLAGVAGAGLAGSTFAEASHLNEKHDSTSSVGRISTSDAASQWHEEQLNLPQPAPQEGTRPISAANSDTSSQYEPDMTEKLAEFPSPPTSRTHTPMGSLSGLNIFHAPLTMSTILSEHFEPQSVTDELKRPPTPKPLTMSTIYSEHLEPVPVAEKPLTMSAINAEHLEPVPVAEKPLTMSAINAEHLEPVPVAEKPLTMSAINAEHLEPVPVAEKPLTMSAITSEHLEPVPVAEKPMLVTEKPVPVTEKPLTISVINSEHLEPVPVAEKPLTMSAINSEYLEPIPSAERTVPAKALTMSTIYSEYFEPAPITDELEQPAAAELIPVPALLIFSPIQSIESEPIEEPYSPRSPGREGIMIPKDEPEETIVKQEDPETPKPSFLGSVFGWKKDKTPSTPFIAEDETRQSPNQSPVIETPESQRPFKEIVNNTSERSLKKPRVELIDESSQTALTAEEIENMFKGKKSDTIGEGVLRSPPRGTAGVPPVLRVRKSQESIGSVSRAKSKMVDADLVHDTLPIKRPGSSGSTRTASGNHPPLPNDHKQVIAAATQRSTSMGPPLLPASAYRSSPSFRPRTPSSQIPASPIRSGTTPRPMHSSGTAEVYSPTGTGNRSRATSVSSFASEIDVRFNMRYGLQMAHGLEPTTDPRMINAITQTMIGEYLWKYTRKAGRGGMSENRHRRYFWVHPYTRTLYWSEGDPSQAGRAELKAKSVAIEAVRVVTDDNPMPPGLHRKSLIIMTPGRDVKFTATTGQRHETWFNALSYLLLRTGADKVGDTVEVANGLTKDDVAEFNPSYGNSDTRRGPASLSSYNSRTTRNESPSRARVSMNSPPQLTPTSAGRPSMGTFQRLSSYWKPGETSKMGSFSSRRSRHSANGENSVYEASEVHDSAEDLREMIEKQDRESDRLENVRACCDGKHDVGHLHHTGKGRHSTTPGQASGSRPGVSSRSQSRNSVRSPS